MRITGHIIAAVGLVTSLIGIAIFVLGPGTSILLPAISGSAPLDISALRAQGSGIALTAVIAVGGLGAMICGMAVLSQGTHAGTEEPVLPEPTSPESMPLRGLAHDRRSKK